MDKREGAVKGDGIGVGDEGKGDSLGVFRWMTGVSRVERTSRGIRLIRESKGGASC